MTDPDYRLKNKAHVMAIRILDALREDVKRPVKPGYQQLMEDILVQELKAERDILFSTSRRNN